MIAQKIYMLLEKNPYKIHNKNLEDAKPNDIVITTADVSVFP